jgi:hypothetical protein
MSGDEAASQRSREHSHCLPLEKTVGITQQSSPPEPGQQRSKQPLQPQRQPAGTVQQQQQHTHADGRQSLDTATAECSRRGCSGCNTTLLCLLVHHSQPKNMQPSKSGNNPLPGPHAPQEPSNILKFPLAHSLSLPVYLQQENTHELKNITRKQARGVLP